MVQSSASGYIEIFVTYRLNTGSIILDNLGFSLVRLLKYGTSVPKRVREGGKSSASVF